MTFEVNPVLAQPLSGVPGNLSIINDFTASNFRVSGLPVTLASQFSLANSTGGYAENEAGLLTLFPANTPRITNKGWLREPAATNLIDNTDWTTGWSLDTGSTKTVNNGVAPDGTTTAVLLKDTAGPGTAHALTKVVTVAAGGGTWTATGYIQRAAGLRDFYFNVSDGAFGNLKNVYFMLGQGGAAGVSDAATVTAWARPVGLYWLCVCTFTMPGAAAANLRCQFASANGYAGSSYTGDGTSGLWMWGPMLVAGTLPTSFVPASMGTRAADVITVIGDTRDNIAKGIGTVDISHADGTIYGSRADLINNNGSVLVGYTSTDALTGAGVTANGTPNRFLFKDQIAVGWDGNGSSVVMNGNAVATGSPIASPSTSLWLGSDSAGNNGLSGYIRHLNVYGTKLAAPQNNFSLVYGTNVFGFMVLGADVASPSYPNTTDWNYFQSKGIKSLRLTIKWENIQTSLGAALDSTQVTNLQSACASAASRGILNIFAPMFTGGTAPNYNGVAIGAGPTSANYANFWSRMATALTSGGVPIAGNGGYHLGNEPSVEAVSWATIVQDSINAIRLVDTVSPIYVHGDPASSFGVGWATASWKPISVTDPNNNIIWDAHEYFDNGQGGSYSGQFSSYGRSPYKAVMELLPFISWAKTAGYVGRAWVGEWGISGYARNNNCTISGNTLTWAGNLGGADGQGRVDLGMVISGTGVTDGSTITANGTGGPTNNGTYTLDRSSTVAVGETITALVGPSTAWLPTLDVFNAALAQSGNIGTMWYYGAQNTNQGGHGYFNPSQQPGGVDDLRLTHMSYGF